LLLARLNPVRNDRSKLRSPFQTPLGVQLFTVVLFCAALGFPGWGQSDKAPPQIQLKTYALHGKPYSADVSPDERAVVTESTLEKETPNPGIKEFEEVVQIWNFKEDKLQADLCVQEQEVKGTAKGYFENPVRDLRVVRFLPNGTAVVALIVQTIYVLDARDLS